MNRSRTRVVALILANLWWGAVGCAAEPPAPISREEKLDLTASVEAIDRDTRMVSLRGKEGRKVTVFAGPDVRNFDQIKVGDEVMVTFYAAIGAEVTKPEHAAE